MPWKESRVENERMRFVSRLESGEKMTELCREFDISRKTGYKIYERYKELGPAGLYDLSRAPIRSPNKIPVQIVKLVIDVKERYPSWGALKILVYLMRNNPGVKFPVRSAIHTILLREGLVKHRGRKRFSPTGTLRTNSLKPNDVWCMDFKGQFRMGNKNYCYPLTVTDHFSRYLLSCEAMESSEGQPVIQTFRSLFQEYGLPSSILSDNGPPFGSPRGLLGLSRLSVFLMRQGVKIERIVPGEPQQNGRHERMHLTLKTETTRPPGKNILHQQEKFDEFCRIFNTERPHEALEMKTPNDVYIKSERTFNSEDPDPEYPFHDRVKYVDKVGQLHLGGKWNRYYIGAALAEQPLGLREEESGLWLVNFTNLELGYIDECNGVFIPKDKLEYKHDET